ncbi:hypothetical protein [Bacillus velezensis]|uniref:hypothetical protein n=2 Tax=Bacillus velezensis TaxID=492670 RepID=UPI000C15716B
MMLMERIKFDRENQDPVFSFEASRSEIPQELKNSISVKSSKKSPVSGYIDENGPIKFINNSTDIKHTLLTAGKETLSHKGDDGIVSSDKDLFFTEIKNDMREREQRTRTEITEREQRFEKQMSQFAQEAKEREERYINDNKEREQRIIQLIENLDKKIEKHASATESKLDANTKHTETMKSQNFWGNIAMFAGLLAIVITLLVALTN